MIIFYNNGNSKYLHVAMLALNKEELEQLGTNGDKIMKEFVKSVKEINNNSDFIEFMTKEEDEEKTRNTYFANGEESGALKKAKETAKNMLKEHLPVEIIIKCTGLSKEEIEELKIEK